MDLQEFTPITMATNRGILAAGTTSTLSTTNAIDYCIKGKAYNKGALTNQATPTTDFVTGNAFVPVGTNTGSIYIIGLNAAGTLSAYQGTIEALDTSGNFVRAPQWGAFPSNFCPIGYIVIKAGSTANGAATGWVFGTSNMASVTGITYAFVDLMGWPDRLQVA